MKFKEFLKEAKCPSYSVNIAGGCIHIRDLGEWAWGAWLKRAQTQNCKNIKWLFEKGMSKDLINQAVACLGKKEIEKRLKKLDSEAKK